MNGRGMLCKLQSRSFWTTAHTSTSQSSRRRGNLPDPKPSWSFTSSDMAIAETNVKLRKGSVTPKEFARLKAIRPHFTEAIREREKLAKESNEVAAEMAKRFGRQKSISTKEQQDGISDQELYDRLRVRGNELKQLFKIKHKEYAALLAESQEIRLRLPNFTNPNSPLGSEENAIMTGKGGDSGMLQGKMRQAFENAVLPVALKDIPDLENHEGPDFNRDHDKLARSQEWMLGDVNSIVAGSNWPFMMGPLAFLEHALVNYAMQHACKAKFEPVVVPDVVNRDIIERSGFSPRQGGGGQIFWISADGTPKGESDTEKPEDLALAATAEIPLAGMCAGVVYDADFTPKQYVATSHAFRAEVGARGLDSKGLYRVHQFTKVEMFIVCRVEQSEAWLGKLLSVQEKIISGLGIPYRVLNMPTEELGASAFTKYDIEAWMPGRGSWGEISSASNCTDYQARRLSIRYKVDNQRLLDGGGMGRDVVWAHTLNGTALAIPRLIVALLENYGVSKEGKIRLPSILKQHWISSAQDQVEWVGDLPDLPATSHQSAIQRVKRMAEERGTDPASMIFSFLVLHELTAIIPLVLIFYLLGLLGAGDQVMKWLLQVSEDDSTARQWLRGKINEGMQRAEKYGRKKGFFGFEAGSSDEMKQVNGSTATTSRLVGTFGNAVAAYAITKALFPLRLYASITLAAPFARLFIEPVKRLVRKRRAKM